MFDIKKLTKELSGVVGLYPTLNNTQWQPANFHRDPVVFLSDAHKLLRPELLDSLGPLIEQDAASYQNPASYSLYSLRKEGNKFYESQVANNTSDVTDTEKWKETTFVSYWYSRIERGAIAKVALAVNPPTKPLLERQALYNGEGNIQDRISKQNRFVGLSFLLPRENVAFGIARLGLQVTGAITDFPVYIFHSSSDQPVKIIRITGTTVGRTIWVDVNEYLYERENGYYLIGYFEEDLPSNVFAIGANRPFTLEGCSGCMGSNYSLVEQRIKYAQVAPILVDGELTPGVMTWAQSQEVQITSQSWGLNMIIDAKCDSTQQIVDNRDLLTSSLLYTTACDMLEELANSDRVNAIAADMQSKMYIALNGQGNSKNDTGLKQDRNVAIVALKDAFSKLSPLCMPAEARRGISFESIFD